MLCPLCHVPTDESGLQQHYLRGCPGSASESESSSVDAIFRWYKTIPTDANEVHLLLPASFAEDDPVKPPSPVNKITLKWNAAEVSFDSGVPVKIPVGSHSCRLIIGDEVVLLEEFLVRSQTKEITLSLKSDSILHKKSNSLAASQFDNRDMYSSQDADHQNEVAAAMERQNNSWKSKALYQDLMRQQLAAPSSSSSPATAATAASLESTKGTEVPYLVNGNGKYHRSRYNGETVLESDYSARPPPPKQHSVTFGTNSVLGSSDGNMDENAQAKKIEELEEHITSLRKCLSDKVLENSLLQKSVGELEITNQAVLEEREQAAAAVVAALAPSPPLAMLARLQEDIAKLQQINQQLSREKEELLRASSNSTNASSSSRSARLESDRRYDELLREKERLEMELTSLKLSQRQPLSSHDDNDMDGLMTQFDPNNPKVLKKCIDELSGQVSDLQEANECAVAELSQSERKIEEINMENKSLKNSCLLKEDENRMMKEQLRKMKQEHEPKSSTGLDLMRADVRRLREERNKLSEENMRLGDQLEDLKHQAQFTSPPNLTTSEREEMLQRIEKYRLECMAANKEVLELHKQLDLLKVTQSTAAPTLVKAAAVAHVDNTNHFGYVPRPLDDWTLSQPGDDPLDDLVDSRQVAGGVEQGGRRQSFGSDSSDSTAILTSQPAWHQDRQDQPFAAYNHQPPKPTYLDRGNSKSLLFGNVEEELGGGDSLLPLGKKYGSNNNNYQHQPMMRSTKLLSDNESVTSLEDGQELDQLLMKPNYNSQLGYSQLEAGEKTQTQQQHGLSVGFRSVSPKPILTQHNKTALGRRYSDEKWGSGSGSGSSLPFPARPLAPRTPADIEIGYRMKFSRQGGKISTGIVKYVGSLPGRNDVYLGVELEGEDGRHDGTYNGQRFFKCKPNKGVFVSFNKVIMVWGY